MLIYYIFFSLSDFSLYNILLVHPCLYKWPHFIPLHGWIIFIVCKYQIPFIHSSIDALWWPEWGESPKGISYTYIYLQLIHFTVQKNLTQHCKATMCRAVLGCSVMSDSLQPHGLQPTGLLCLWGFCRQEYWSRLPCPPPEDPSNPGIEPRSPTLQADSLLFEPPGKPLYSNKKLTKKKYLCPETSLTIITSRYRWANFFFLIIIFLDDEKFLLYVCGKDVCVCVWYSVCVLCMWRSSASCISASGHPSAVREVSPSLWEISRVYLLPRPLITFQGWFIFTFVLRKQTGFIFFQVVIGPLQTCQRKLLRVTVQAKM